MDPFTSPTGSRRKRGNIDNCSTVSAMTQGHPANGLSCTQNRPDDVDCKHLCEGFCVHSLDTNNAN